MSQTDTKRKLSGLLLIDKPKGVSSNHILQRMKYLYNAKKAGHTGALDPLATGMLPICFGEATKFSQFLLNGEKTYEVEATLGIKTTTADAEGEVISTREITVCQAQLAETLEQFKGTQSQTASIYSALKHQGVPLYKLARKGKEAPLKQRDITIYQLELLDFSLPTIRLRVHCSKGTYIRSLVDDLGEALGCGAYVTALHRVAVAGFTDEQMHCPVSLEAAYADGGFAALDAYLLGPELLLGEMPRLDISGQEANALKLGQKISGKPVSKGLYQLFAPDGRFIGVGEVVHAGQLKVKRLLSC